MRGRARDRGIVLALGALAAACGDPGGGSVAATETRDVVFEEVLVPDVVADTASPDTLPDAADTRDASDDDDTRDAEVTATDTGGPPSDSGVGDGTSPDVDPDASDTSVSDAADSGPGDAPDTRDVADTGPAPFCGDDVCDEGEDCLGCLDCTCPERCGGDVFLSEYLEGPTGFNKALEIMNATGRVVSLEGYTIWKITNGGDWSEAAPLMLTGTIAPGAAFVVCHASAAEVILGACDLASSQDAMEFNGNDAVALVRQGVIVDAVGEAGPDPGAGFAIAGVADATKDHRLVRDAGVVEGSATWSVARATWRVEAYATSGLGAHAVAATCASQDPAPARLNEIVAGQGAADFVELVAAAAPVDLSGWSIATTGGSFTFPAASGLAASGYRAVARAELGVALAPVDIVWLYDAAGTLQDVVAFDDDTLGGAAAWGRLPDLEGAFQALRLATPGAPNQDPDHICGDDDCDEDEGCETCVADCGVCLPLPGELVVSEVLVSPTAGPEWLEVTSVASVSLELAGLVLADDGSDFHPLAPTGGSYLLAPGARVVLGSAAAAHVDLVYSGFALDADDEVVLVSAGEDVDRVAWSGAPTAAGVAWSLDPSALDTADNDLAAAWCAATSAGPDGQLGTPGEANPICAAGGCGDESCGAGEDCTSCPDDCAPCASCAVGLFLSEYVEGTSFNKALEIANFTGAPVDLGQYALWKITNDGTWSETTPLFLSGTLAHGDVYVVCNEDAGAAVLAACDRPSNTTHMAFNGDDALGLAYGATLIDAIGTEATSGAAWAVAGVANATLDHVLVRKPEVSGPTTDWGTSAAGQWQVLGASELGDLGRHTYGGACP